MAVAYFRQGDWMCPTCNNHNYQSKKCCNRCGTPGPEFRDGDWMCPTCNNHNYASKATCNKCGAPKVQTSTQIDQNPKMHPKMREGDWICQACNNHNYKDKWVCNKCGGPHPENPGEQPVESHGTQNLEDIPTKTGGGGKSFDGKGGYGAWRQNGSGTARASPYSASPAMGHSVMGGMAATPSGYRDGDWMCEVCKNHNYASRQNCNKCGAAQSAMAGKGSLHDGAMAGKGGLLDGVMAGKGGLRDGDWICEMCQNHNYARRQSCNKCGAAKDAMAGKASFHDGALTGRGSFHDGALTGKGSFHDGGWMCEMCEKHNPSKKENCMKCGAAKGAKVGKGGLRPGDWVCTNCWNHNYQGKNMCNKCGGPKGRTVEQTNMKVTATSSHSTSSSTSNLMLKEEIGGSCGNGVRGGDWMCQQCGNHNYASKAQCNRCGGPKGPTVAEIAQNPKMRPGDWICQMCNNHNYKDKWVCNRCGQPHPENHGRQNTEAHWTTQETSQNSEDIPPWNRW